MTAPLGIDFAWAKPDPHAVAAPGYQFVMGYLSGGGTKDLTAAQVTAYRAAGLQVGLVWETTAARALSGASAGAADGAAAEAEANQLGYPPSCVIFAAVDEAVTTAQIDGPIRAYMAAFSAATRRPVGVYGSYYVVSRLVTPGQAPVGYGWQTEAWSSDGRGGYLIAPQANLLQRLSHTWSIAGVTTSDWDEDVLLNPLPLYGASVPEADLTPDEHTALMDIRQYLGAGNAAAMNWPADQSIGAKVNEILTAVQQPSDPQAVADAVVAKIQALPAPQAAQVAQLVLAGLNGAQLSVAPPPPAPQPPAA